MRKDRRRRPAAGRAQKFARSSTVLPCARVSAAEDRRGRPSPSQQTRRARALAPLVVVLVWAAVAVGLGLRSAESGGLSIDGELEGLVPEAHRSPVGEPWLMLRADQDGETAAPLGSEPAEAARSNLLAAALAIAQAMPDERVSLAPPANAVTAWLDAHGLYLLPADRHAELADRLEDEKVSAAIQGLVARLSSPLFGASGEQARRDPLGLKPVLTRESGQLGHVRVEDAGAASVTGSGDLLSADGKTLVIQLVTERRTEQVLADARAAIADLPVSATMVGPAVHREVVAQRTTAEWPRMLTTLGAALTFVLALALRRIRPVLCLLACLASGVLLIELVTGAFDPLSLPLLVLIPGFSCGAALRLQRISTRGWASGVLIATALIPLWLSPYPEWERWSVQWLAAAGLMILLLRIVMPALLSVIRASVEWRKAGFILAPMPALGLLLLAGLTTLGAWAGNSLRYAGADALEISDAEYDAASERLRQDFFDPRQTVEARTPGPSPAAALERTAIEAEALGGLVGPQAVRLDSPGSYVIPAPELEARMQSLSSFELPKRMQKLHDTLEAQGLRADAFTEFLHGAADIESIPTAQAALDDALGTWMSRYVVEQPDAGEDERWVVRSVLQLRPKTTPPVATTAQGDEIPLLGPAIAARHDSTLFRNRVGVYVACGLWLGAFIIWLGAGSLAIAISSAVAGLATQSAVLGLLALLRQPMGPHLLPVLLLVGVAGMIAAGRACQAVDLRRPLVAGGLLTTGICQIAAGITLLASTEALWRQMGLVIAVGSATAIGLGLFAAPGMCQLLRRATGGRSDATDESKDVPEKKEEEDEE